VRHGVSVAARTNEDVLVRTKPSPFGRELFPAERYNRLSIFIMPPRTRSLWL